jgi:hypothetical protein
MAAKRRRAFDVGAFLSSQGTARRVVKGSLKVHHALLSVVLHDSSASAR